MRPLDRLSLETVLIVASVIAGTKPDLNIASVILTAAGAAIIGRMIGYVIGCEYGYWLLLRYGGLARRISRSDHLRGEANDRTS